MSAINRDKEDENDSHNHNADLLPGTPINQRK